MRAKMNNFRLLWFCRENSCAVWISCCTATRISLTWGPQASGLTCLPCRAASLPPQWCPHLIHRYGSKDTLVQNSHDWSGQSFHSTGWSFNDAYDYYTAQARYCGTKQLYIDAMATILFDWGASLAPTNRTRSVKCLEPSKMKSLPCPLAVIS